MNTPKNTFPKTERLKKKQQIESLFRSGRSLNVYPFRLLWSEEKCDHRPPLLAGVTVPARTVRTAARRNLMKRRFREAFRREKHPLIHLLQQKKSCINLFFIYKTREILPYRVIRDSVKTCLERVREQAAE